MASGLVAYLYPDPSFFAGEIGETRDNAARKSVSGGIAYVMTCFLLDELSYVDGAFTYGNITDILYMRSSDYACRGRYYNLDSIRFETPPANTGSNNIVYGYYRNDDFTYSHENTINIGPKTYRKGDQFDGIPPTYNAGFWDFYLNNAPLTFLTQNFKSRVFEEFNLDLVNAPDQSTYDQSKGLSVAQLSPIAFMTRKAVQTVTYLSIEIPDEPDDFNTNVQDPSYAHNPSNDLGYNIDGSSKDPQYDHSADHPDNTATAKDPNATGDLTYNGGLTSGTSAVFLTDKTGLDQFWSFFWGIPDITTILLNTLTGMFNSLSAQVMSIQMLPFTAGDLGITTVTQAPVIGRYVMKQSLPRVTDGWNEIDFCEFDIKPISGKSDQIYFYDLKPYTTIHISLPFMSNTIELDTNIWMGQKLIVALSIDLTTGRGLYKLKNGSGQIMQMLECQVASGIPYCLDDNIANATQIAQTAANTLTGVGITKSIPDLQGLHFEPLKIVDSVSSATNAFGRYNVQILIQRPIRNVPKYYGQTVGYRCLVTKKLDNVKGFFIVENPVIRSDGQMTETEMNEIVSLLQNGVRHNY